MKYLKKYSKNDETALIDSDYALKREINRILRILGIPDNLDGFLYLTEAIFQAIVNPKILDQITKEVYPLVGKTYGKTADCVEHSMRYAIEKGWRNTELDYVYEQYFYSLSLFGKPTTSLFIRNISSDLRYRYIETESE